MVRTQVYLEAEQVERLRRLASATGRRQSALIREAIDALLEQPQETGDRVARIRSAAGAWADRDDLDELMADNRRSVEERLERLWR